MVRYALTTLALAAMGLAQTAPFTDANTGIKFAAFTDPDTGVQIGIALPETLNGDVIAQLVAPTSNATGWVGLSLGPDMTDNLLVAAWPSDSNIIGSFRETTDYVAPPVFNGTGVSQKAVPQGTFINSTHYSYTFLCSGCTTNQPNFVTTGGSTGTGIGWAFSNTPLADPADPNGALNFHEAGYGIFSIGFADAQTADFQQYAALATGASNSTSTASTGSTGSSASGSTGSSGSNTGSAPATGSGAAVGGASVPKHKPRPTKTRSPRPRPTGARPGKGSFPGLGGLRGDRAGRGVHRPRPTGSFGGARPISTGTKGRGGFLGGDAGEGRFRASFLDEYYGRE